MVDNSKPKVLVCDDDQRLVKRLTRLLASICKVIPAYDVESSIQLLQVDRERRPTERFSAVVIDLEFPGPDGTSVRDAGFDILREAKKDAFIEAIIYTSRGSERDAYKSGVEGAFRYVPKDVGTKGGKLYDAVCQALEYHDAVLGLAQSIDMLASSSEGDSEVLAIASTAYRHIMTIRGRSHDESSSS